MAAPTPTIGEATDAPQLLGQLRPSNTTAASLYSPSFTDEPRALSGREYTAHTRIKSIVVCNTSGASAKYRIFLDDDGTTYDETTAMFWDVEILTENTHVIDTNWSMSNPSGNLGVRTSVNDALTFTVFGDEVA